MAHRPAARPRPAVDAAPRIHVVQTDTTALTGGGHTALLESATQEILPSIWGLILSQSGFPGAASM